MKRKEAWADFDYETWLVLAKALLSEGRQQDAAEYLARAGLFSARFTDEQRKTYERLQGRIKAGCAQAVVSEEEQAGNTK